MPLEDHDLRTSESAAAPPPGAIEMALAGIPALPENTLILIPTRNLVLFPGTVLPITLGRQRTIAAAQAAIRLSRPVGLVLQRDAGTDDPIPVDLHRMGTEASLLRYVTSPDGTHHAICQGERRFRILDFVDGYPFLAARVEHVPEVESTSKDIAARLLNLRNQAIEVLQLLPQVPGELVNAVQSVTSAPALADLIASFMDITPAEKQEILETIDVERRLDRVSAMLAYRIEVLRLSRQISEQTKGKIDDRQREFLLREQIKTIQKELGEGEDAKAQEIAELAKKIARCKDAARGRGARQARARPARADARDGRRVFDGAHLSRMADRAALVGRVRECDRHRRGAPHPRRRPLRPAKGQAAYPRIPGDPPAQPGRPQPDPVLCRPARCRQDLARAEHRPRDGPEIRPGQPRRYA